MALAANQLQTKLGHQFVELNLLENALRHRSCGVLNNERMEFLGDALLGAVIADNLFHKFPDAAEGELSRLRARLVNGVALAVIARELGLGKYLILGPGEMKSGGHRRDSILADTVEAIIGAIYLDAGMESARAAIERWFGDKLKNISVTDAKKDAKTLLQELLQGRKLELPSYQVVSTEGEVHDPKFEVTCNVILKKGEVLESSEIAGSRRIAEQKSAASMLNILEHKGLK